MKKFLAATFFGLSLSPLFAEVGILKIIEGGKKVHVMLDNEKDYELGDVINFYQGRELVTQGKIVFLTPRKTKAIVEKFRGKPFEGELMARARREGYRSSGRESSYAANEVEVYDQYTVPKRQIASTFRREPVQMRADFSTRTTQDLFYYPEERSFLVTANGRYNSSTLKLDGFSDIKSKTTGLDTALYYSPLRKLALGFGLGYASTSTDSSGTTDSGSGLVDPSLYVSYQLMNLSENNFFWIIGTQISPSIGKRETSNVLRGNNLLQISTTFGMRYGAFGWSVGPKLSYYTETKDETTDMSSYYAFGVDLEAQYDFNQNWAIYSPFLISYTGEQSASDDSFTIKSFYTLGLGLGVKYAATENLNFYFNTLYSTSPSVTVETTAPSSSFDGDESSFEVNLGTNFKF